MTPQQFIAKWKRVTLSERSACQQHFLDLCELLGQPKPADVDSDGSWYTFERGVHKTGGGKGWADVWMRGHFGWEYKGKHKDLVAAYQQLLLYREDLENPPLLVVCDMDRFEVHTNFTGTAKVVRAFDLDSLADPAHLETLRRLFAAPESLKPGQTTEAITEQAAELFGQLADGLRLRGIAAPAAAHFLMKLMFCMFADDIDLLPGRVFTRLLTGGKKNPAQLTQLLRNLFASMSTGGLFGADEILYFNGGLFADTDALELTHEELAKLITVNGFDWSQVEPSIFGTLFERTLDPQKRSQIGAHYTSRADIETLLQPVMMAPLRREWGTVRAKADAQWEKVRQRGLARKGGLAAKPSKERVTHEKTLRDFVERLAHVTVLDPACGSGNFLYVALHLLLNLEKEVITYAAAQDVGLLPQVRPTQLAGIEINPYAQQLAQVVIWIGYLQWMRDNGFSPPRNPVLEPIESIKLMDAVLDLTNPAYPHEPEWPNAEFVVGNPPFLGDKKMRAELGMEYVIALRAAYAGRVPGQADFVCYWFEKARDQLKRGKAKRCGLLATNSIRGGANRAVLDHIKRDGDIFFAESDREWILEGAAVNVSMVGFDEGGEGNKILDGRTVSRINPDLTALVDVTTAKSISTNPRIAFIGTQKGGLFDLDDTRAREMLMARGNPNGRPNSDIIRPWVNGLDIVGRPRRMWIIDFTDRSTKESACQYETPFRSVIDNVKEAREKVRSEERGALSWWLFQRSRPEMRLAFRPLGRYIASPRLSKHRLFVWLPLEVIPDSQLVVFASDQEYIFGILNSVAHVTWSLKQGTSLEDRPRYTPSTSFETFPFPQPSDAQREAIGEAAKELDRLRNGWLNPPEWTREEVLEFPGSVDGPWDRYVHDPDGRGVGTIRYPRLMPRDEDCEKELKKRTLTKLYNQRPTWLELAHQKLDAAVFAAYGWDPALSDDDLLAALLALNQQRAART